MGIAYSVKSFAGWFVLLAAALIFLFLAITGRLAIFTSIAFLPDNVAFTGGS